ncbi:MAG TPA: mannitol dehydrogenase family protein [Mesorhizobium sp.]|jgi:fructuronate reductase|nr:mannitol dehydrogenase family protein [Mesorhizobium sp.]
MTRLSPAALAQLPPAVRRPSYHRAATRIGFAHIGVGAFHRCHQAEYTEDVLEAGVDDRAEIGVNICPPSITDQLDAQDGLFTRMLVEGDRADFRVIGAIRRVIDASPGRRDAVAALADPNIDVITATVTEKGYCHVPATGFLDAAQPAVLDDLARRDGRSTLPGLLAKVFRVRMASRAPVTLLSCDNIPANGRILRSVVLGFAEGLDKDLARWIEDNVRFPSTMVDRIVPATRPEDFFRVQAELGLDDRGAVVGEPFRQWVIEDDFNVPRPRWDFAGAAFVRDVEPYEQVKMRVLNACQTALSCLGALKGLVTTYDDIRDPTLAGFVQRMILAETAAVLPNLRGMEVEPYLAQTIRRLGNSAIRHTNHQIATDTSQKINQRILQPIRDRGAKGLASPLLETAVAAWLGYLARSQSALGATWEANDPVLPATVAAARASGGDVRVFARAMLGERGVFGALVDDAGFAGRVAGRCHALLADGVDAALGRLGTSGGPE